VSSAAASLAAATAWQQRASSFDLDLSRLCRCFWFWYRSFVCWRCWNRCRCLCSCLFGCWCLCVRRTRCDISERDIRCRYGRNRRLRSEKLRTFVYNGGSKRNSAFSARLLGNSFGLFSSGFIVLSSSSSNCVAATCQQRAISGFTILSSSSSCVATACQKRANGVPSAAASLFSAAAAATLWQQRANSVPSAAASLFSAAAAAAWQLRARSVPTACHQQRLHCSQQQWLHYSQQQQQQQLRGNCVPEACRQWQWQWQQAAGSRQQQQQV
jgi:hypothetical protein